MTRLLRSDNAPQIAEFLSYPMGITGYGHVKMRNKEQAYLKKETLLRSMHEGSDAGHAIAAE
jgi:indolepyruvate ferredoxin oxidoreductase